MKKSTVKTALITVFSIVAITFLLKICYEHDKVHNERARAIQKSERKSLAPYRALAQRQEAERANENRKDTVYVIQVRE